MHHSRRSKLSAAAEVVHSLETEAPQIGLVLGSGLGSFAETLERAVRIPYARIPFMPETKVSGHVGNLVLGQVVGTKVACLQGRAHLYEGHEIEDVVFGVRLLVELGCRCVLLTNAAGGINAEYEPGDLVAVRDHINLMGKNPLVGPADVRFLRFPDMTEAYSPVLRKLASSAARAVGLTPKEGVYAAMLGPSFETPAEIRMLKILGADLVGMSTVPEVIALREMNIPVAAMSCVTNWAAGISGEPLSHQEVEHTAKRVRQSFLKLLTHWIEAIRDEGTLV